MAATGSGGSAEVGRVALPAGTRLDRIQARIVPAAFLWATLKKYLQDEGSQLAAMMAYYMFLSMFPLAVAGYAVLNLVLSDEPDQTLKLVQEVVPAAYQQQVIDAYQALPPGGPTLTVALIVLLLTGTGAVMGFYVTVNRIYAVPFREQPTIGARYPRVLAMLVLLGVGVLAVALGSTVLGVSTHVTFVAQFGGFLLLWAAGFLLLYSAAKFLCSRPLGFAELGLGAGLGSAATTLTITVGSSLVADHVETTSAVYGVFASAVTAITVLFIVSNAVVLSFEASAVLAWQLWPRSINRYLQFPADERALTLVVLTDELVPSQRNVAAFDAQDDDPRRIDPATLLRRTPGAPRTPYDR